MSKCYTEEFKHEAGCIRTSWPTLGRSVKNIFNLFIFLGKGS
jgi:hypothetical protein